MDAETASIVRKAKLHERLRRYGLGYSLVLPFVTFFTIFTIILLTAGIVLSFFRYDPNNLSDIRFVGLDNYTAIFSDDTKFKVFKDKFWGSFKYTLLFDVVCVPLLFAIPLFLAVLINLNPPGYKLFRSIIYLPSIVSVAIAGLVFNNMFAEKGVINYFFGLDLLWLDDELLRWVVILILSIWWTSGTNFVIFSAALRDVPKSLYEACETDGGGKWQKMIHVTLPNIKGHLSLCLFSTLIGYLGLYAQPSVIRGATSPSEIAKPDSPMMFIQAVLNQNVYAKYTGMMCAFAVVFGLIIMTVTVVERRIMGREKGGHKNENRFQAYKAIEK